MRIHHVRFSVLLALAVVIVGLAGHPASAAPALVSELTFAATDPAYDPYGGDTAILGDVTVTQEGWLDFFGRAVVETPDRPALNPGTADFAFGVRLALTRGVGDWNVMQKGNWGDQQWKLSTHVSGGEARLSCRISGSSGAVHVFTDGPVLAADATWHQVGCARVGDAVHVQVDGQVVAEGFGSIGSVSSTKPYLIGSKGAGNLADPDQYLGLLDDAFVSVEQPDVTPPPTNRSPTARLTADCSALTCTFDATGSSDPDGDPLTYSWDLGDGTLADGAVVTHTYSGAGTFTAAVEVRDPDGATSRTEAVVQVSDGPRVAVGFRGAAGAETNSTSLTVPVPAAAQAGDSLLLAVSANRSDLPLQAPPGWQLLGRQPDGSMQTQLWLRTASPDDLGGTATVTITRPTKLVGQVLAYSGTDAAQPVSSVASSAESGKTAAHTTPVTAAATGSWVVSLWANKSSSTTGWTAPSDVVVRDYQGTSGSGRVTSLVADSGGPVDGADVGGLTATASQAGGTATMWTVVLRPG